MKAAANQVGISQRIRLEWLEATANLVLAGQDKDAIQGALNEMLADKLSVNSRSVRGSRHKTITILTKIWRKVPTELKALRDDGLERLPELDSAHRQAMHWGMTIAAYPFWGVVAAQAGRLLRLQGAAGAAQVQRRVREQHGERQTVSRATARVLRSFVDWGVLEDTEAKGVYVAGKRGEITDPHVAAWLAEALLRSNVGGGKPSAVLRHPSLFPFRLPYLEASQLAGHSSRLEAVRHALDDDFLMLRTCPRSRSAASPLCSTKRA